MTSYPEIRMELDWLADAVPEPQSRSIDLPESIVEELDQIKRIESASFSQDLTTLEVKFQDGELTLVTLQDY